jgi:predicted ATP-dependent protease
VIILSSYLREHFAHNKPLALTASLCFEQTYGMVDGDSASSTELYALLSAIAEVPIFQGLAVTGSVSQKGEIQPIGGATRKIEGYFDICKHKGLTGKQGVLIPAKNVKDLMLKKEVVQAVEDGLFHVYPVKTIEQGIEILTGMRAGKRRKDGTYTKGSLFRLVDERLLNLAEMARDFGKGNSNSEK